MQSPTTTSVQGQSSTRARATAQASNALQAAITEHLQANGPTTSYELALQLRRRRSDVDHTLHHDPLFVREQEGRRRWKLAESRRDGSHGRASTGTTIHVPPRENAAHATNP
jgi:hypothetical protein